MRRRSFHELIDRARQAMLARLDGHRFLSHWTLPRVDTILANPSEKLSMLEGVSGVLGKDIDTTEFRQLLSSAREGERLRQAADRALAGRFDFLGVGDMDWGQPIDWHLEPVSGRRSPPLPWKKLDSLDASTTGDKKFVWELNRQQYLFLLGRAYWSTGDDRYAAAVGEHILSWIRANPPGVGINWVSSLELAFRSISWLWALAAIRSWSGWPSLPLPQIAHVLFLHGRHIERFLSSYTAPNTHLTGEALGLYYLGTHLPELEAAGRWRSLGRAILLQQLDKHVRPDGVYFEQSTWYHRYTADFYLHFLLLARRNGERLPDHVEGRLVALLDHMMWITRPDGTSPRIGDDDGGKLAPLRGSDPNDWRAALSSGAVLFGREDYKHVAGGFHEETYWLLGGGASASFEELGAVAPDTCSRAFPDGGIFIMRSGWDARANYMLVDCGPHGAESCSYAHAHADALSIEVAALGKTMLVDPGTFTYTGSGQSRDRFRSTAMHNTLTVDGLSSSVMAGPFRWARVARSELREWHDHPLFTYFSGAHDGYARLDDPVTHSRSILFANREYWIVLDRMDSVGKHDYAMHFHLASGLEVNRKSAAALEAKADGAILEIAFPGGDGTLDVIDDEVSEGYGAAQAGLHARYAVTATGKKAILFLLYPKESATAALDVREIAVDKGRGMQCAAAAFDDLVLWSTSSCPDEGIAGHDFEWIWARRARVSKALETALFLHGKNIAICGFELTWDTPVQFAMLSVKERSVSIEVSPPTTLMGRFPNDVGEVSINGRLLSVNGAGSFSARGSDIPRLRQERSDAIRCNHVRH